MTDDPADVLQRLYDSEINARIEWVWDGGVKWCLGDEYSGGKAEGKAATVALAVLELAKTAVQHYPKSDFATWWKARSEKSWRHGDGT
jgi:hypothetical protein